MQGMFPAQCPAPGLPSPATVFTCTLSHNHRHELLKNVSRTICSKAVVVVECSYESYVFSHSQATSSVECNRCSPSHQLGLWATVDNMCHCYSAPDRGAEYCDEHVCVCVFVCPIISLELQVRSSPIFCAC